MVDGWKMVDIELRRERQREYYRSKVIAQKGSVAIRSLDRSVKARIEFNSFYTGDCIVWTGATDKNGYGRINVNGENKTVYRVAYELEHGPIPEGLEPDHLCRNPPCLNVGHLEAVSRRVNTMRGMSALVTKERAANRTHCKNSHELTEANTIIRFKNGYRYRMCRRCVNDSQKDRKSKRELP